MIGPTVTATLAVLLLIVVLLVCKHAPLKGSAASLVTTVGSATAGNAFGATTNSTRISTPPMAFNPVTDQVFGMNTESSNHDGFAQPAWGAYTKTYPRRPLLSVPPPLRPPATGSAIVHRIVLDTAAIIPQLPQLHRHVQATSQRRNSYTGSDEGFNSNDEFEEGDDDLMLSASSIILPARPPPPQAMPSIKSASTTTPTTTDPRFAALKLPGLIPETLPKLRRDTDRHRAIGIDSTDSSVAGAVAEMVAKATTQTAPAAATSSFAADQSRAERVVRMLSIRNAIQVAGVVPVEHAHANIEDGDRRSAAASKPSFFGKLICCGPALAANDGGEEGAPGPVSAAIAIVPTPTLAPELVSTAAVVVHRPRQQSQRKGSSSWGMPRRRHALATMAKKQQVTVATKPAKLLVRTTSGGNATSRKISVGSLAASKLQVIDHAVSVGARVGRTTTPASDAIAPSFKFLPDELPPLRAGTVLHSCR